MSCQHTPQSCDDANSSASCDDNNPCTRDSYGENGCVHYPVNCDDVNTPLLRESSNADSVEFLSPVLPEIQNEAAKENTTINESQSVIDDGNDSINESIDSSSILSENNSTALSSSEALMAGHRLRCDDNDPCTVDTFNGISCEHKPKICDDGNPSTFDYCYGGVCYNTTTSCDDGNPCTIDSYNGTSCVHTPRNCNDGNPCTVDDCDRVRGCRHSPVVCGQGKTCIDGGCQYLYYPYAAPYYPYYPYVAPASTIPSAQSYTIPAGTTITLPWPKSVTALNTLKVENGIAYPGASPLKLMRSLGLEDQAVSGYQTGLSISERAEMIGLSWKDASFALTLIQPDGSTLPAQGDNRNVMHLMGSNYDYYFLRNAAKGNWGIEVKPINPDANGVGFSLITGLVKGAASV